MPATATDTLVLHRGDPYALAELLALPGAIMEGHFQLLSGLHTDRFVAFSRIAERVRRSRPYLWLARAERRPPRPTA